MRVAQYRERKAALEEPLIADYLQVIESTGAALRGAIWGVECDQDVAEALWDDQQRSSEILRHRRSQTSRPHPPRLNERM